MVVERAPFPWFGGKRKAAPLIWERFGDVANYVEPFFGSGAVLLSRPHEPRIETINDVDAMVSNFWRATSADPEQVAHYADWPVSEPDLHARHRWLVERLPQLRQQVMADPEYFDAKVAGWWCWGLSSWIGSGWCDGRLEQKRPAVGGGGPAAARGEGGFTAGRGVHALSPGGKRPHLGSLGSGSGSGIHKVSLQMPRCHGLGGIGLHAHRVLTAKAPNLSAGFGNGCGVQAVDTVRNGAIYEWFAALQARLRRVRVCCGDWTRIMGPSVILGNGFTGILLDPPYKGEERTKKLYAEDDGQVSAAARLWAIEHGDNPRLRIALCGYETEHTMPASWSCETWGAPSGYGGGKQRARERIWFSPHCLRPDKGQMSLGGIS